MTVRKTQESTEISIMEISRGQIHFKLLGITPMICHAMSAKVMQELLLPAAKKNAAEKASNAKHHVMTEFRDSMYKAREADAPTRIVMPAVNFKQALCCAAIDIPGAARTQMSRLTFVENDYIPIYGIPQLLMSVVRNSDIKRTPDVRTRAILPRWACYLTVTYTRPLIKEPAICNLLAAAGITQGIGDWRVQKGSGTYGQFELVGDDNLNFEHIVATGGRAAQDDAIANPIPYDSESEQLLSWYQVETKRRGFKVAA